MLGGIQLHRRFVYAQKQTLESTLTKYSVLILICTSFIFIQRSFSVILFSCVLHVILLFFVFIHRICNVLLNQYKIYRSERNYLAKYITMHFWLDILSFLNFHYLQLYFLHYIMIIYSYLHNGHIFIFIYLFPNIMISFVIYKTHVTINTIIIILNSSYYFVTHIKTYDR